MKKRNCRKSEEERRIHEQAVKLRKMTDEQLVATFELRAGKPQEQEPYEKGFRKGLGSAEKVMTDTMIRIMSKAILDKLKNTRGVGTVTIRKVEEIINEYLESGRLEKLEQEAKIAE